MLHEFLTIHRADLIERCRLKVANRRAPQATDAELEHGIPLFIDQLIKTLRVRDLPGTDCIFTIDLPRHSLADPAASLAVEATV